MVMLSILMLSMGCTDDFLEKQPLAALSAETFWQTETDAFLGLTGVYSSERRDAEEGRNFIGFSAVGHEAATDNGCMARRAREWNLTAGGLSSSEGRTEARYDRSYVRIGAANNFLENIDRVQDIDEDLRAQMIAEVRFIRAYQYFWLTQFFGDVPLVTKLLTVEEANAIERTPKSEVVNFILTEMTEAIPNLPLQRPDAENGRIIRAAAYALQGRMFMAEKRWSEASDAWKAIIDMDLFELHSNFKEIFEDGGDGSKEVIYAIKYVQDLDGQNVLRTNRPIQFGGNNKYQPFNSLVVAFDMIDGMPQDQSPLFDPMNPYANKDPRLYATMFIPEISTWQGSTYVLTGLDFNATHYGFALRKFLDEEYDGDDTSYGSDFKQIRYAEVLLSYLESEFEANGGTATQALLDETVNIVRARVDMPAINNADISRDRIRNERRVELAWEGLRYWDILRWDIAEDVFTNNPEVGAYLGNLVAGDQGAIAARDVDENGYVIIGTKAFNYPTNNLWPIPQAERDINSNLSQNPGY
jgi:hypothetical protein